MRNGLLTGGLCFFGTVIDVLLEVSFGTDDGGGSAFLYILLDEENIQ